MRLLHGDCREVMRELPENSVDAIVTDPPYGIEFMGKSWDSLDDPVSKSWTTKGRKMADAPAPTPDSPGGRHGAQIHRNPNPRCDNCGRAVNGRDTPKGFKVCSCEHPAPRLSNTYAIRMQSWHDSWAREAYRVLKPGGHMFAFGGTRTVHRLTCAIEDAGFEIRDKCLWLYGSGFPKSHNLHGEWEGWGTALKPAHEDIVLARKPLIGTVAANVAEHGTGALHIEGCRIETTDNLNGGAYSGGKQNPILGDTRSPKAAGSWGEDGRLSPGQYAQPLGRWPANVILDEDAAALLDAQSGERKSGSAVQGTEPSSPTKNAYGEYTRVGFSPHSDTGGASRFFLVAQPDSSISGSGDSETLRFAYVPKAGRRERSSGLDTPSTHPTVKPVALTRWLCRLITPPGETILDPFLGSGTTGIAAGLEGFDFIGIEQSEEYLEIARRRIQHWAREAKKAASLGPIFDIAAD